MKNIPIPEIDIQHFNSLKKLSENPSDYLVQAGALCNARPLFVPIMGTLLHKIMFELTPQIKIYAEALAEKAKASNKVDNQNQTL